MEVSNEAQGRALAKKKQASEIEEQRLQMDLARAQREREKAMEAEREKGEKEIVEISSAASHQMDSMKKLNSDRVQALGENANKHYESLAAATAADIKRNDEQAFHAIQDRKMAGLDKILQIDNRSADPFYNLKTLAPVMSEAEKDYKITVALPEHEAKNLFVSGEGQYLKLSLARRFQDNVNDPKEAGRSTKTNSYQSISEQIAIPGSYDGKKITREYKDGVVIITVPKTDFTPKTQKNPSVV